MKEWDIYIYIIYWVEWVSECDIVTHQWKREDLSNQFVEWAVRDNGFITMTFKQFVVDGN